MDSMGNVCIDGLYTIDNNGRFHPTEEAIHQAEEIRERIKILEKNTPLLKFIDKYAGAVAAVTALPALSTLGIDRLESLIGGAIGIGLTVKTVTFLIKNNTKRKKEKLSDKREHLLFPDPEYWDTFNPDWD